MLVVDNNSRDKSREVIENYKRSLTTNHYPTTTLYLEKNLGFAGGNNEGIKKAKGTYVILLNNDCIVDKDWLTELVKVAEGDEQAFAVGSKVYLQQTNKIQNAGIQMFEDGYGRDIGAIVVGHKQDYAEDKGQYDRERETYAACAVAALYRKSILDKIGLLDDTFFMYYEDVDLSFRIKKAGYNLIYQPASVIYHEAGVSLKNKTKNKEGYLSPYIHYLNARNKLFFLKKHTVIYLFPGVIIFNFFHAITFIGYFVVRGRFSKLSHFTKGLRDGLFEKKV